MTKLTIYALTDVRRRPIRIFARERLPNIFHSQDATRRIELVGDYDLSQQDETAALFDALSPDGPATIDLTKVTFIDSSFLHELTRLRTRLIPQLVTLVVHRGGSVRRLLRLVNFDVLFEIQTI